MQPTDLAIPVLRSRCVADTLVFFRRLGFEGDRDGFNPSYLIIRRGAVELHFVTHTDLRPGESGASCYIRTSDVESIYEAFSSAHLPRKGVPRMQALEDKPWGMREFAIVDPDGNVIRIGQELKTVA